MISYVVFTCNPAQKIFPSPANCREFYFYVERLEYERTAYIINQTCEEIFGGSDAAVGNKLGGERRSKSDRRSDHRLHAGGVLYCVDPLDQAAAKRQMLFGLALRLTMLFVVLNCAVHISPKIFFMVAASFMIFYAAALLGLIITSYRQSLFDDDE